MISFLPEDILGTILKYAEALATFKLALFAGNRYLSRKILKGATHIRFDGLSDLVLPKSPPPSLGEFQGLTHVKLWASYNDFHPTVDLIMSLPPTVRYLSIKSSKSLKCFQKYLPPGTTSIRHRSGYTMHPIWHGGPVILHLNIMFPLLEHLGLENGTLMEYDPTNITQLLLSTLPPTITYLRLNSVELSSFDLLAALPPSITGAHLSWNENFHVKDFDTAHLTSLTSLGWYPSESSVSHFSSTLSQLTSLRISNPEHFKPYKMQRPTSSQKAASASAATQPSAKSSISSGNAVDLPENLQNLELTGNYSDLSILSALPTSLRCLKITDPVLADADLPDIPSMLTELHVTLGFPMRAPMFPLQLTKLNAPLKHRIDFSAFVPALPKTLTHFTTIAPFPVTDAHMRALPPALTYLSIGFQGSEGYPHPCPSYSYLPPLLTHLSLGTLPNFDPATLIPILPPRLHRLYLPNATIREQLLDCFPMLADFDCHHILVDASHFSRSCSNDTTELSTRTLLASLERPLRRLTSRPPLLDDQRYLTDDADYISLRMGKELVLQHPQYQIIDLPAASELEPLLRTQGPTLTVLRLRSSSESAYGRKFQASRVIQDLPNLNALESYEAWPASSPIPATLTSLKLGSVEDPCSLKGLSNLTSLRLQKFKLIEFVQCLPPNLTFFKSEHVPLETNICPGIGPKFPRCLKRLELESTTWEVHALRELPKSLEVVRVGCVSLSKFESSDYFLAIIRQQQEKVDPRDANRSQDMVESDVPLDLSYNPSNPASMDRSRFLVILEKAVSEMCGFKVEVTQTANHKENFYGYTYRDDMSPFSFSGLSSVHMHLLNAYSGSLTRLDISGAEAKELDTSCFRLLPRTLTQARLAPTFIADYEGDFWRFPSRFPVQPDPSDALEHVLLLPPRLTALDYFCTAVPPNFLGKLSAMIQHLGIAVLLAEDSVVSWPSNLESLHIISECLFTKAKESLPLSLKTIKSVEFADRNQSEYTASLPKRIEVVQIITHRYAYGRDVPTLSSDYTHLKFIHCAKSSLYRDPLPPSTPTGTNPLS